MNISNIQNYVKNNSVAFFNIFLISYILGPVAINIFSLIVSLLCIFLFLIERYRKINFTNFFLIIPFIYIFIKEFFYEQFNFEYFSFLRLFFVILFFSSLRYENKFYLNFMTVIIVGLISYDSFIQYFTYTNILGFPLYENYRITSFFYDEPIVGGFLVRFVFIFIVYYLLNLSKKNIFILIIFFLPSLIVIFFTGERMPVLHLIFSILITFFWMLFNKDLKENNAKRLIIVGSRSKIPNC